ncbi:hypothetical protein CYMTET_16151, partial [Cymbomonas tetramitiformis]
MPFNINEFDFRLEYAHAFRKFCKCAHREPDVCSTFVTPGFLYKCRVRKIVFESGNTRKPPTHLVLERAKLDEDFRAESTLDECETIEATDKIFKDGFFIPVAVAKKWKLHPFDCARTASSAPSGGVIFKPRANSLSSRGSMTSNSNMSNVSPITVLGDVSVYGLADGFKITTELQKAAKTNMDLQLFNTMADCICWDSYEQKWEMWRQQSPPEKIKLVEDGIQEEKRALYRE